MDATVHSKPLPAVALCSEDEPELWAECSTFIKTSRGAAERAMLLARCIGRQHRRRIKYREEYGVTMTPSVTRLVRGKLQHGMIVTGTDRTKFDAVVKDLTESIAKYRKEFAHRSQPPVSSPVAAAAAPSTAAGPGSFPARAGTAALPGRAIGGSSLPTHLPGPGNAQLNSLTHPRDTSRAPGAFPLVKARKSGSETLAHQPQWLSDEVTAAQPARFFRQWLSSTGASTNTPSLALPISTAQLNDLQHQAHVPMPAFTFSAGPAPATACSCAVPCRAAVPATGAAAPSGACSLWCSTLPYAAAFHSHLVSALTSVLRSDPSLTPECFLGPDAASTLAQLHPQDAASGPPVAQQAVVTAPVLVAQDALCIQVQGGTAVVPVGVAAPAECEDRHGRSPQAILCEPVAASETPPASPVTPPTSSHPPILLPWLLPSNDFDIDTDVDVDSDSSNP